MVTNIINWLSTLPLGAFGGGFVDQMYVHFINKTTTKCPKLLLHA